MAIVEQQQERPDAVAGIRRDRGKNLSLLWVFAAVNYIFCDVLALMDHDYLRQVLTGSVGGVDMTRGFLLTGSVLMEIPMAMIVLSWVLRPGPNRIANLVAGSVMTVVQLGSLFVACTAQSGLYRPGSTRTGCEGGDGAVAASVRSRLRRD